MVYSKALCAYGNGFGNIGYKGNGEKGENVRNYLNYSSGGGLGPIKLKSLHGRSGDGLDPWEM